MNIPRTNTLKEWQSYFKDEQADNDVYAYIQNLRSEVEELNKWIAFKKKAKKELKEIDPEIISRLLQTFAPFIGSLPAGHGAGHLGRDLIHSTLLFYDPTLQEEDSVELFAGMIGGIFHDIGNSVIERYAEPFRFTGHAEVGAFLFDCVAKDILPDSLRQLIAFVIASHTNYLKDIVITKKGKTIIRKPYLNYPVSDGLRVHKIAAWMAQATDRLDAFGVPVIFRMILTKAVPTTDYSNGEFHKTGQTEEQDFIHQFNPALRTKVYKATLQNDLERTTNVLEHLYMFCETAVIDSPYSRYDSPFFLSRYIQPLVLDELRFMTETIMFAQPFHKKEKEKIFSEYFQLSAIIEPAYNTQQSITLLSKKFPLLSPQYYNNWTHGLQFLITTLYPKWYKDIQEFLIFPPYHKNKIINDLLQGLYTKAKKVLEVFNPLSVSKKQNLIDLLQKGIR